MYEDAQDEQTSLDLMRANTDTLHRIDRSMLHFDRMHVFALFQPQWTLPAFHDVMDDFDKKQRLTRQRSVIASEDPKIKEILSRDASGFGTATYSREGEPAKLFESTLCQADLVLYIFKDQNLSPPFQFPLDATKHLLGSDLKIDIRNRCAFDFTVDAGSFRRPPFVVEYGALECKYLHLSHPIDEEVSSSNSNDWVGD